MVSVEQAARVVAKMSSIMGAKLGIYSIVASYMQSSVNMEHFEIDHG